MPATSRSNDWHPVPLQADNFNLANSASARALAGDSTLNIELRESSLAAQLGLAVPLNDDYTAANKTTVSRGLSDAIALIVRHHNSATHRQLQPQGEIASLIFNDMERSRCTAIGARKYTGVNSNLSVLLQQSTPALLRFSGGNAEQLRIAIDHLTRTSLQLHAHASRELQSVITNWRDSALATTGPLWQELAVSINNQYKFGLVSLKIIDAIDSSGFPPETFKELSSQPTPTNNKTADEFGDEITDDGVDENTDEDTSDTEDELPEPDNAISVKQREEDDQPAETLAPQSEPSDSTDAELANRDAPVSADSENSNEAVATGQYGYRVYSTANDEVVTAEKLCTNDELAQLRTTLDEHLSRHAKITGQLSGRLQRVLMSQQQRHWTFDKEEGTLDTTRLTRVVTEPLSSLSFKTESDIEFKNTTVTLLVDNSKSMLGKPIAIAAACADLLAQTLERCGVSVEILGFTTTQLHAGKIFDHWQSNGATQNPGRLNGLRHIIYKSADMPYRRARKNFGLMLHKDLLKQNIDGEALLWAHERLLRRPEQRRILMVISDGAPIDTSTMSANDKNFLIDHLHQVIATIEKRNAVELVAIGIGHDVTQYYRRAMKIMDAKDLSKSMLAHLSTLFTVDSRQEPAR